MNKRKCVVCSTVLGSEFREQPRSTEVAVGTDVVMGCRPPRGEPEPRVRWNRDGDPVRPDDRVTISDTGTLRIRDASTDDSAVYVCVAYNIGGERESSPARLTVRGVFLLLFSGCSECMRCRRLLPMCAVSVCLSVGLSVMRLKSAAPLFTYLSNGYSYRVLCVQCFRCSLFQITLAYR